MDLQWQRWEEKKIKNFFLCFMGPFFLLLGLESTLSSELFLFVFMHSFRIRAVFESRLGDLRVVRGFRWTPVFCGFMSILEILRHYHLDHFPPLYLGIPIRYTFDFFYPCIHASTFLSYFSSPSLSVIHLGDFFRSLFLFTNSLFSSLPKAL